jgi:molybdopterin-containing oxidoreductase family iron-sulfur binding subunit
MTYNRCVGTRYCGNACPYKVRRFNWWTYKWNTMGEKERDRNIRALNPDVTVRTRGVMEKCNFCVGRLRDAKLAAKERSKEFGRDFRVQESDVKTACQQTCPSDAIVFGDLKNTGSTVARLRRDPRAYLLLGGEPEEKEYGIKTLPNVSYLMKFGDTEELAEVPNHAGQPEHG